MANTKSATAFRRQKRQLTNPPVKSYSPSSTGGTLSTLRTAVMDGKPLFTPWEIPRILTDPVVQFGLNQLVGPLTIVEWDIKAKTPEVAKFVENTAKKFWRRTAPLLAFNYFAHGFAPGVHQFDQSEEGEFRYEGCRWVDPRDATAVRWTGGKDKGKLAGFRLIAGLDGTEDEDTVTAPFAAWYAGLGATAGLLYDTSRLSRIYRAWLEKNTRGGVLNSRQLYFRTHAFRGQVIYHPPGDLDPNDPSKGSNRDYGLYIADTLENGSSAVFPDIRTPGEGRNEPAWRIQPIEGNASAAINILEYAQEVDREILLGLGIPPEVVEAAETGSGYSGRQIPFQAFMTNMDLLVGPMVGVIEPAIRALVGHNYDGAEFTIDTIPLAETVKRQNDPNAKSAVGNMAPGGQQDAQTAGDAAMAGSGGGDPMGGSEPQGQQAGGGGGGDPTGGGLVPYLGKRGGQGRKDPRTGRVYYLSHSGSRLGCLMADIPEPLADAVLSFANSIPDEHLVDDGRVVHPHVTILHGYQQLDPTPILNHVATLGSLSFTPGELRVFENDDADVLYVACEDAKPWSRWHRAAGELPHEPSQHGGYVPHMTVAYLKKGKGKLYAGKTALKGGPVPVSTVLYSGPDGRESRAQVWPSEDELGELFREAVDLAWTPARSSTGNTKAVWEGPGERKPLYGENADRVLRGDLPVAEKLPNLPTAQRVAMPEVGRGQKLVRATDYREGMEPPVADRPRDSLDREIAAANKKPLLVAKPVQKQPLPVAKRAEQKQPPPKPQLASRPKPPAPPPTPPQPKPPAPAKAAPTAKKPPEPKPKSPEPKLTTASKKPQPPANQGEIVRQAFKKAQQNELNDPMGYGTHVDFDSIPAEVGEKFDAHGMSGEKNLINILNNGVDPNRSFYSDTLAGGRSDRRTNTGMDLKRNTPFVLIGKPGVSIRKGGVAGVIVSGHHAPQIPDLERAFPGVKFIPADQAASVLKKLGGNAKPVQHDAGDTHPEVQKPKPPVESSDWEDEYRALQNRHDDARVPLKQAELKRLYELQVKAGVPEAMRVKI